MSTSEDLEAPQTSPGPAPGQDKTPQDNDDEVAAASGAFSSSGENQNKPENASPSSPAGENNRPSVQVDNENSPLPKNSSQQEKTPVNADNDDEEYEDDTYDHNDEHADEGAKGGDSPEQHQSDSGGGGPQESTHDNETPLEKTESNASVNSMKKAESNASIKKAESNASMKSNSSSMKKAESNASMKKGESNSSLQANSNSLEHQSSGQNSSVKSPTSGTPKKSPATLDPISFLANKSQQMRKIFRELGNKDDPSQQFEDQDIYFNDLAEAVDSLGRKHGYTALSEYIPRAELFRKDEAGRLKINWLEFQGAINSAHEAKSQEKKAGNTPTNQEHSLGEESDDSVELNISTKKEKPSKQPVKQSNEEYGEDFDEEDDHDDFEKLQSIHKVAANIVSANEPLRLSTLLKKKHKIFDVLFKFYANSRSHSNVSRATFDNIATYSSHITRPEFLRCCLDFQLIPLLVRREVAVTTFQDVASLSRGSNISQHEFPHLLAEIMVITMNNLVAQKDRDEELLRQGRPCVPVLLRDTCLGAIIESISNGQKVKTVMQGLDMFSLHRVQKRLHDLTTGSASKMSLSIGDEDGRFYYVKAADAADQKAQAEENYRRRELQRKILEALMEDQNISRDDLTSFEIDLMYGVPKRDDAYSALPGSADIEAHARRIIESEDTDELLTSIIHKQREDRRQKQTMIRKKQFDDLRADIWQNASYAGGTAMQTKKGQSKYKSPPGRKGSTSSRSSKLSNDQSPAKQNGKYGFSGRKSSTSPEEGYDEDQLPASLKDGSPGQRASKRSSDRAREVMSNSKAQ
eukprot:gb/GECG01015480.1/.p1 GENE.gb/GECG01015480.1/~~gb/GECG01015480.1/.p1  ORF type:complete len:806 (+),score=153.79 gb/GECG01015480.1/:1-2418(+)